MMRWIRILMLAAVVAVFAFGVSCSDTNVLGDMLTGNVIPLLPLALPIFPTDVTLDGLAASVEDELDDIGMSFLFDNDDVLDFLDDVEEKMREASLEILQPGVLSVAIDNQITEAIRSVVEVTRVGVNFSFENMTDDYVAVPTEFKLFLGEASAAEAFDDSTTIQFADERVENGQFVVPPGESIELSIANVPHLVDMLNNAKAIGIGYKNLYRPADVDNGADVPGVFQKFGLCLVEGLVANTTKNCPGIDELLGWHLSLKDFELVLDAEADIEIPGVEDCADFADSFGLDRLKEACPSS
ncbi:hypothetical protein K8I61_17575 [bacterium]|nr:hypothetical protein [bacterium]